MSKFSDSGSKNLYFPYLKVKMFDFLYNFELAVQDSHKYL